MIIYYNTFIGDELINKISDIEFRQIVDSILSDKEGWPQYGYKFIHDIKNPQLKIYIRGAYETEKKLCKGLPGLSCTRFKKNGDPIDIIINYNNWIGGSKSELSIEKYHKYVINHEVGHWLGIGHTKCPIEECKKRGYTSCPASIMQQMSKGPNHISPCVESYKPLPYDWIIDDPTKSPYLFSKTNRFKTKSGLTQNKAKSELAQNKAKSELTQNKAKSELTQNKAKSELAQNKAKSELAQNKAKSELKQNKNIDLKQNKNNNLKQNKNNNLKQNKTKNGLAQNKNNDLKQKNKIFIILTIVIILILIVIIIVIKNRIHNFISIQLLK